jgi:formate dehydrogenase major subunit
MFAWYLYKEDLVKRDFIEARTEGWEEFTAFLDTLDMDAMEKISGVDRKLVRAAAVEYGSAKAAMEFHGLGVTEHWQGTKSITLILNIAMMTGNIGRPGCGINPLRGQNNVQGAADMGVQPHQGAGYLDVTDPASNRILGDFYGIRHPAVPGLRIPEMFGAASRGTLKAMWIMGEDLLQTDPNTCHVRSALGNLEFLVVQELFMTDTARIADVVFPASSFFEKEGTFTNGERRIQKVQRVVDPLPGTLPDGDIVILMMNAMGYHQNSYSAGEVLNEISGIVPFFRGVTRDNLGSNGIQWPVKADGSGTEILHTDTFKRGKGKFHSWSFEETPELAEYSDTYPFILTTGRGLVHYNSGTMTRRTANSRLVTEDILLINPSDAGARGIVAGDYVTVFSARGSATLRADLSDKVLEGVLSTTFHFPETAINFLTGSTGDEFTVTPEYKIIAVDIKKALAGKLRISGCAGSTDAV